MYLELHPKDPQLRHLGTAVDVLRDGGVIIYPTDTIYGLGCSIFATDAIKRIYGIKQQEKTKPFSFICSDLSNISEYAKVSNAAFRFMKQLIPGPFTFVLPASRLKQLPKSMISKRKTVGIRVPDNTICRELVRLLGHPILNASVEEMNGTVLNDPEDIKAQYRNEVDVILACGNGSLGHSTVIDLTGEQPEVLREGVGDITMVMEA